MKLSELAAIKLGQGSKSGEKHMHSMKSSLLKYNQDEIKFVTNPFGSRSGYVSLGLIYKEEAVGMLELSSWQNMVEFGSIHINKEHRRKGIAAKAIKAVCKVADKLSVKMFLVPKAFGDIGASNSQLERLYAKFGFVENEDNYEEMVRFPK